MRLLLASLALVSILAGCGGSKKAAPRSDSVGWAQATQLLRACKVKAIDQTHARVVTLTLRDGGTVVAHEPRIDDMFHVLSRLPLGCRPSTVGTE
jgi:hypothetical protein